MCLYPLSVSEQMKTRFLPFSLYQMLRELNTMSRMQPYFRRWKAGNALPAMKSSCGHHLGTASGPAWLLLAGVMLGPVALLGNGEGGSRMLPIPGGCPRFFRAPLSPRGGHPASPRAWPVAVPAADAWRWLPECGVALVTLP